MDNLCLVFGNVTKALSFSSGGGLGFLPAGMAEGSHDRNYGRKQHVESGSGGRSPCPEKCADSGSPKARAPYTSNRLRSRTFLLRVMGRLADQLVFPVEAAHISMAGALRDGSRPHILV
jgi:hypothetical protein